MQIKKILHIDMDAFFSSVEQRDFPSLRGKPVIVGGNPNGRGVVAAASYEARKFGIHSAMPSAQAVRLCPHAVFRKPRFEIYKAVSAEIRDIFADYTNLIEPLSLDEAYLDVTENLKGIPSGTIVARMIRSAIERETGLTASAGVAYNKFLAKIASDVNKPNGIFVITPDLAESFLEELPIGSFYGVGKATKKKMEALGIQIGKELKQWDEVDLVRHFGKQGHHYYHIVRGRDDRVVKPNRIRKSVGKERTFVNDIGDINLLIQKICELSDKVALSLERLNAAGRTLTLKVRYRNFETVTRSITTQHYLQDAITIADTAEQLLHHTDAGVRKVRLLGVSISSLKHGRPDRKGEQLEINFRQSTAFTE